MALKIGVISPPYSPVPPPGYSGTELVCWNAAKGLHALGHKVSLTTVEGSGPADFKLVQAKPDPQRAEESYYEQIKGGLGDFDAVIDATNAKQAHRDFRKVLNVHHWCQHPSASSFKNLCAVSGWLSAWLAERCPSWRRVPFVYNPVDVDLYPFTPEKGDYLLFFSAIAKYKGALEALEVAKRTGHRMIFAGRMGDAGDEIKAAGRRNVEVLGEVSFEKKVELMRHAKALVFPTGAFGKEDWQEVFGLVQAEAMATGTPVLAARNGATPEVVEDGVTGFLCGSVEEMAEAVSELEFIDPAACRRAAEERFSIPVAARGYGALCERLAKGEAW